MSASGTVNRLSAQEQSALDFLEQVWQIESLTAQASTSCADEKVHHSRIKVRH